MQNVLFSISVQGGRVTLTVEESVEMSHLLSGFDSASVQLHVTIVTNGQQLQKLFPFLPISKNDVLDRGSIR